MRRLLILLLFVMLVSNIAFGTIIYHNDENGYEVVIEDDADIFTDEEENLLGKEMQSLTQNGNIILKTINKNNRKSTEEYAEKFYHSLYTYKTSGTLLLFDMDLRYIYIFSDGSNYDLVTAEKAITITDNVYNYASSEEYYECASNAFSQIESVLNKKSIFEPMKYITKIIISLLISTIIVSCAVAKVILSSRKNSKNIIERVKKSFKVIKLDAKKGELFKKSDDYIPDEDYDYSPSTSSHSNNSSHDSGRSHSHSSGGGSFSRGSSSHSSGGGSFSRGSSSHSSGGRRRSQILNKVL